MINSVNSETVFISSHDTWLLASISTGFLGHNGRLCEHTRSSVVSFGKCDGVLVVLTWYLYVCMNIYVYIYMYIYSYSCIYIHIYKYIGLFVRTHKILCCFPREMWWSLGSLDLIFVCMYKCKYVYTFMYLYIHIYIYMNIYIYICIYT
jgi:hypothetical protein